MQRWTVWSLFPSVFALSVSEKPSEHVSPFSPRLSSAPGGETSHGQFSLIITYLPQTEEEQPGSVYILLLFVDLLLPPVTSDPGTAAVTLGCHLET